MTSMMYPVMFPAQQPEQFSGPHFFTQQHVRMPAATMTFAGAYVPEELRCQYSSKRCENTRTNKKSGGLHKFCAVHREKANRNQMRLDHRRRVLKRMAQREQQQQRGSRSAPSSVSGSSSPYQKRVKEEDEHSDEDESQQHRHKHSSHSHLIKVEDDLEIDLMPLALHSENASSNPRSSSLQPIFDPQDLHILEALLFSDEDQVDGEDDGEVRDAASVCHGECCGHASPSSSSSSSSSRKHSTASTRSTVQTQNSPAAVSSWSINL